MAHDTHGKQGGVVAAAAWLGPSPAAGTVRACALYRDELARHRLITADGQDFVVATADQRGSGHGLVTGAYPVVRGYLVMMRQPLCVLASATMAAAQEQHAQLVQVLAQTGTRVVKARRRSAAWRRAEGMAETGERTTADVASAHAPASSPIATAMPTAMPKLAPETLAAATATLG